MSNKLINLMTSESLEGQAVNARDLHEFLIKDAKGGQKGRDFTNWIKENLEYLDAKMGQDFITIEYNYKGSVIVAKNGESKNQRVSKRDYVLTLSVAKEISMIQNNDKGREARKYFIECEKQLKEISRPKTRLELAREQLLLIEEIEAKDALLLETTPKAEKYDKFLDSDGLQTATQVGQLFGLSAVAFNKILSEEGVYNPQVKRTRVFSIGFVQNGYGKTIESTQGFSQSLFTAKGIDFVAGLLKDKNINPIGEI